jgi:hypothetical protein
MLHFANCSKQKASCLKQKIGMIAAVSIFGLFGTVSAEEITLIHFYDQSTQGSLGRALYPTDASKGVSFGISVEERRASSLGTWYSKSALEDYDFKFRGMTTAEKVDTLGTLKAAMDEFEILHGVRDTFESSGSKFENYIKKFMLKGDFNFNKEEKTVNTAESRSTPKKKGKTSSFFYELFVPDRIKWNLDASLSNRGVGAEVNLGEYLSIKGDVGDDTEAFMMFKIDF